MRDLFDAEIRFGLLSASEADKNFAGFFALLLDQGVSPNGAADLQPAPMTARPNPSPPMGGTPGPWRLRADPYEDGIPHFWLEGGEGFYDQTRGFSLSGIVAPADAYKMAAGPEMYEALIAIELEGRDTNAAGDVTIPSHVADLVQTALHKARGS